MFLITSAWKEIDERRGKSWVGHVGQLATAGERPRVVDYLNLPIQCQLVHAHKTARFWYHETTPATVTPWHNLCNRDLLLGCSVR